MNFCPIGPVSLAQYFKHAHSHMALAQYLYDPDYFNLYRILVLEGKFVILDSGVYEKAAVSERELLYWIERLRPAAIILPDVVDDFRRTAEASAQFADKVRTKFAKAVYGYTPMLLKVLHAQRLEDFEISYLYDSRLYDGVCFSRLTESFSASGKLDRPGFIKRLQEKGMWRHICYHHALGMADGSLDEFHQLKSLGVNSCDSSAPVWRGAHTTSLPSLPRTFDVQFDPFYVKPDVFSSPERYIVSNLRAVGIYPPPTEDAPELSAPADQAAEAAETI